MICIRIEAFTQKPNDILKHGIKLIGIYFNFCLFEIEKSGFDEKLPIFDSL